MLASVADAFAAFSDAFAFCSAVCAASRADSAFCCAVCAAVLAEFASVADCAA